MGFCVARSTGLGDARALNSGMSNSTDSHAFLCMYRSNQKQKTSEFGVCLEEGNTYDAENRKMY